MFCVQCGNQIPDAAVLCVKCGTATGRGGPWSRPAKTRLTFILLGVFLGGLGIHNFYVGYFGRGIAQLLVSLLTGWLIFPLLAVWIWVIVELCTVTADAKGNALT